MPHAPLPKSVGRDCIAHQPIRGAEEALDAIADQLTKLADEIRRSGPTPVTAQFPKARQNSSFAHVNLARQLYHIRRKRSAIFGTIELFGEPASDLLLDLFIAHSTGNEVSVSSACIGAAVPATTALRHLGILQQEGLVLREQDERDQRRINVRLSQYGVEKMEAYFSEIAGCTTEGKIQPDKLTCFI